MLQIPFHAQLPPLWRETRAMNEEHYTPNIVRLREGVWQTFVVVSVTVGIVALSVHFFILLITQVNAEWDVKE